MFGFLKKKLNNAISTFSKKNAEKVKVKEVEAESSAVSETGPEFFEENETEDKLVEGGKVEAVLTALKKEENVPKPDAVKLNVAVERKIKRGKQVKPRLELKEKKVTDLKLKTGSKIKRVLLGKVTLSEKEVADFCWEFELLLLESDVEIEVAKKLADELKSALNGAEISRGTNYTEFISKKIRIILEDNLAQEDIDFLVKSEERNR